MKAPGQLATLEQRRVHFIRKGAGSPAVIFEGGLGATAISWCLVQDAVAEFTETLSWDRPGYGWSDARREPLTMDAVVQDLTELLQRESVPGPYVLVGHSLGGIYVRRFAQLNPELVAGIVQVDPSHERMNDMMPQPLRSVALAMYSVVARAPRVYAAMGRRALRKPMRNAFPQLDDTEYGELLRFHTTPAAARVQLSEMKSVFREMHTLSGGRFGDIPLVILGAGKPAGTKGMQRHRSGQLDELAAESTRGRRAVAEKAGHLIPFERPDAVVDVVREVVEAVRETAPVLSPV